MKTFRYRNLSPDDSYYAAWRCYRRRTLQFVPLIPIFFAVVGWALLRARDGASGVPLELVSLIAALSYVVFFIVMGLRWRFSKCPRCCRAYGFNLKKPLAPAVPGWFRSKCPHCELKLWEPAEK